MTAEKGPYKVRYFCFACEAILKDALQLVCPACGTYEGGEYIKHRAEVGRDVTRQDGRNLVTDWEPKH